MIIKRYAPIVMLVLLLASCSTEAGMSLDEYEQMALGLSYNTVVLIADCDGEMLPGSTGTDQSAFYTWRGFGERDASATLEFRDGLLLSKSQQGLKRRELPDHLQITYDAFINGFLQTAILASGGMNSGAVSLDSYDYIPLPEGAALRTYTVWQSPEGGFVRLQALCNKEDYVVDIETVYDSIAGNPEADAVYLRCSAHSLQAYIMAKYSLEVMDRDIVVLCDRMLAQGNLGFAQITESIEGAVSTYKIAVTHE